MIRCNGLRLKKSPLQHSRALKTSHKHPNLDSCKYLRPLNMANLRYQNNKRAGSHILVQPLRSKIQASNYSGSTQQSSAGYPASLWRWRLVLLRLPHEVPCWAGSEGFPSWVIIISNKPGRSITLYQVCQLVCCVLLSSFEPLSFISILPFKWVGFFWSVAFDDQ